MITIDLRCAYLAQPLALDTSHPELSWSLLGTTSAPSSCEVTVTCSGAELWRARLDPYHSRIIYAGPALGSDERCEWKVRVEFADGSSAEQSSTFETGPLLGTVWDAAWIRPDPRSNGPLAEPTDDGLDDTNRWLNPVHQLVRNFEIDTVPASARLYATAHGVYSATLNDRAIGDQVLAPGWTDYDRRVLAQAYDITQLLVPGENVLRVELGDGWYAGLIGPDSRKRGAHYGWEPEFTCMLRLMDDGATTVISTDDQWRWRSTGRRYSDLLEGELYISTEASDELRPVVARFDEGANVGADMSGGTRVVDRLNPSSIVEAEPGRHIVDFGQNLAGRIALRVAGLARGTTITLRHAEVLDDRGELYVDNLRTARATDRFVCDGSAEQFVPLFTYHGFRYVEVNGYQGRLEPSRLFAEVVSSDGIRTGRVETSDALLTKLQSNIEWSQRSNIVSVPTDCPQRDERLGWGGDAQVFLPTAAWNTDIRAFLTKWVRDLTDAQDDRGAFPDVAPQVYVRGEGAPGYADAGVTVPWILSHHYGDQQTPRATLPNMMRWVEFIFAANPDGIWTEAVGFNYGDWLSPGVPAPHAVVATASFGISLRRLSEMARALHEERDAARVDEIHRFVSEAFIERFVDSDGRIVGDTQTGYVLGWAAGFFTSDAARQRAAAHLGRAIGEAGSRIATGFLGVAGILPTLSEMGMSDAAWQLVLSREYPSWGYSIDRGATTIWERWDGIRPDGTFQTVNMNSFNHFCLGSVGQWLYGNAAGIAKMSTGSWARVEIAPEPTELIERFSAQHLTEFGWLSSGWTNLADGQRQYTIDVPPGITATFRIPPGEALVEDASRSSPALTSGSNTLITFTP